MPEKEPDKSTEDNSFKVILDKLEATQKEIDTLKESLNKVTAFNRELLSRKSVPVEKDDSADKLKVKFEAYLKGE